MKIEFATERKDSSNRIINPSNMININKPSWPNQKNQQKSMQNEVQEIKKQFHNQTRTKGLRILSQKTKPML